MSIPDVSNLSIHELISLTGKTAVITGGARGIGLAIGKRFAEAGANLIIADLDEGEAHKAAETLRQWEGRALGHYVDVVKTQSIQALIEDTVREMGNIDIWVNNAGIYPQNPILEISDEEWEKVLDIDVKGAFLGAREAARCMVAANNGGVIINLASTAAFIAGHGGLAHYVTAKHGIIGLTKSLAVELGAYNIRVLALAPTLVATPGTQKSRAQDLINPNTTQDWPLGRVGIPDDVARVALFCASDLAVLMTGSTLLIDAGRLAV